MMSLTTKQLAKIDAIFERWDRPNTPGMALAIKYQGETVYRCYGMADLKKVIQIQKNTVFQVASLAKQFTAMCIVLLVQRKLLALDDEVKDHISGFPFPKPDKPEPNRVNITIRHLLHHTSGLLDCLALTTLKGLRQGEDEVTRDMLLDLVMKMETRRFTKPETDFCYSNTNFFLAGEIVREVSGMPLSQFAQKNIFGPLGMKNTSIIENCKDTPPNSAQGYRNAKAPNQGFEERTPLHSFSGPSNLFTTVEDLMIWDDNFATGDVGTKYGINMLLDKTGDAGRGYGLGLFVAGAGAPMEVYHNGIVSGHRAQLHRYYDEQASIVLLSNIELDDRNDEADIDVLVEEVESAVLGLNVSADLDDRLPIEVPEGPAADPAQYVGQYSSDEINTIYEVTLEEKSSVLQLLRDRRYPVRLIPVRPTPVRDAKHEFWIDGFDDYYRLLKTVKLTFQINTDGAVAGFSLDSASRPRQFAGFPFKKVPKAVSDKRRYPSRRGPKK
jgi:CubicO group peptidase (beta-lactamase class C family)